MANPVSSYSFTQAGLSVTFKDTSTNGPINTWLWDFGFMIGGVPQTSSLQNPAELTFPQGGLFNVSLTVTGNSGSNQYTSILYISLTPSLNYPIIELVLAELPSGISINTNNFNQILRKWQLFYQPAFSIADADVFDETKYPPLANVLIAKLIIYDFIMKGAQNLITSMGVVTANGGITSLPTTNTLLAGDFSLSFDFSQLTADSINLTVLSILVNSQTINGPSGFLNTSDVFLAWINSLGIGIFTYANGIISSISNTNALELMNYQLSTDPSPSQVSFAVTNQKVITQNSQSGAGSGGSGSGRGPVKTIKTGPSEAEWYDGSIFWSNLFKTDGIVDNLKQDICIFSRRVHVVLPFCKKYKTTALPIVSNRKCC